MGAIKHRDKVMHLFEKTPTVSIASIKKIVGEKSSYVNLMLTKMVQRGKIHRITRGVYSLHDDPTIAVFCFKPAYLGLQEALSIHNLWEQETNVIILTTKTVREGVRKINGSNVLLKRIPPTLFFGIEYKQYGDFYLPVSDVEKTLIDMVYFQQPIDAALRGQFRKRINKVTLREYLQHYDAPLRRVLKEKIDKVIHNTH
jgi:predicted transcriptional regulator of viral defense system